MPTIVLIIMPAQLARAYSLANTPLLPMMSS